MLFIFKNQKVVPMQKVLNSRQIKIVDRLTIDALKIQSIDLMEKASLAVYEALMKNIDPLNPVYVFAGPGNNGGDALAVARMLLTSDIKAKVFFVAEGSNISEDCLVNKERINRLLKVVEINIDDDIPSIPSGSIVIDGLFGSGLNRPLEGIYAKVVQAINKSEAKVFSIDIPSGLFLDNNSDNVKNNVVKAHTVFTFQLPKLSLLLPDSAYCCKNVEILDIGLSPLAIKEQLTDYYLVEKEDVSSLLSVRDHFAHKGNFGHALLVVGSQGKIGAAVLASTACLRTGVGLLTVHVPQCGLDILQSTVPEAMVDVDAGATSVTQVDLDIQAYTVGLGCGIGTSREAKRVVAKLLQQSGKPLVIDADALNIIAQDDELKYNIPQGSIITPHPLEFERLVGQHFNSAYERLQEARLFANRHKVYIVLKGAYTAIITPDKKVYFNSTGNPGMATGGSGDALTGIITSLLAQYNQPFDAALLGVYLHGLAGDLAANIRTQQSMLPSDLIACLGDAFHLLEK